MLLIYRKRKSPLLCRVRLFLSATHGMENPCRETRTSYMKRRNICKHNLSESLQADISSDYDRQAREYQCRHNRKHPHERIWRHILYRRSFFFYREGQTVSISVEIVRFIYAGTNKTFTFLGSLFRAFSRFPWEFLRVATASPQSPAAFEVCAETALRCEKILASVKLHNSAHGTPLSDSR